MHSILYNATVRQFEGEPATKLVGACFYLREVNTGYTIYVLKYIRNLGIGARLYYNTA